MARFQLSASHTIADVDEVLAALTAFPDRGKDEGRGR